MPAHFFLVRAGLVRPVLLLCTSGDFAEPAKGQRTMTQHGIEIPRERIENFCRANGIRRLALFGSVLRADFRPESDVDVLVEFQPGTRVGLAFIRMQDELSAILGRTVDLNTPGSLSKYFRAAVLDEAEALYVAA
jgi:predicted nucleotidyltransferase